MRKTMILFVLIFSGCLKEKPIALGTLERERVVHNATAAEIIDALPIAEGSEVKQGDLLVKLDDRQQQARLLLAEAQWLKTKARWDELQSGARSEDIEAARAELVGAEASYEALTKSYLRIQKLRQEKVISQAEYDQALALRDSALARVKAAEEKLLVLTNGVREEVLRQAEADMQVAQAQVEIEQIKLDELSVTATRNGILDSLPWNVGERVNIGTPVAIVLADGLPYARVYIPETVRAKMHVGQKFEVKMDGIDNPETGVLRWVANEPAFTPYFALNESDRSRLMYLAELDIPTGMHLPSGMPVQIYADSFIKE